MTPTLLLHGLQGSNLRNRYDPNERDSSIKSLIELQLSSTSLGAIALGLNGEDAAPNTLNYADGVSSFPYSSLISAIKARNDSPVYPFAYDWRQSASVSAFTLLATMTSLRARFSPSDKTWDGRFNFVCHSFGGVVFRQMLAILKEPAVSWVNKVVFIAVPNKGTLDTIDAIVRGNSRIFNGRKELRKAARTFPSTYELLPSYEGSVTTSDGTPVDVFDVANWQSNVRDNGSLYSVTQERLDQAKLLITSAPSPIDKGLLFAPQCLSIVGASHNSTPISLHIGSDKVVDFGSIVYADGDDIVTTESSTLHGVDHILIQKIAVSYFTPLLITSLHAALPALDEVHTIVGRFFNGASGHDLLPAFMSKDNFIPAQMLPSGRVYS